MSASKLVKPAIAYQEGFLKALDEYHKEGRYTFLDRTVISKSFKSFVDDLNDGHRHTHKTFADWVETVPETTLWMVKNDEYIGSFKIRHRLNWHLEKWGGHINFLIRPSMRGKGFGKKILQKGMPFVCYLGVDRALITVDPAHKSAAHIIEFCGGKYEDTTPNTVRFPERARYWLECC